MRKVLFVIGQLGYGGAERQLWYLIKGLDREKYQPILGVLSTSTAMLPEFQALNVPIVILKNLLPRFDVSRLFRLIAVIKRLKPDFLHAFLMSANIYTYTAAMFTRQEGSAEP